MSTSKARSTEAADKNMALRPLRNYQRYPDVEEEIEREIASAQTPRSRLQLRGLKSETIVYLIRSELEQGDRETIGAMIDELGRRLERIVEDNAQGFDEVTLEEIAMNVGLQLTELLLAETPTPQSDFLEAAFRVAIRRRTLNEVQKRRLRTQQFADVSEDAPSGDNALAIDSVDGEGPSPEKDVLDAEAIRVGLAAVTDPRHREALILRYLQGWPVTAEAPETPTLTKHFQVSARQLNTWRNQAIAQIREATGEQP